MSKACDVVELRVRKHKMVALLDCGETVDVPEQQLQELIRQVFRGRDVKMTCTSCE